MPGHRRRRVLDDGLVVQEQDVAGVVLDDVEHPLVRDAAHLGGVQVVGADLTDALHGVHQKTQAQVVELHDHHLRPLHGDGGTDAQEDPEVDEGKDRLPHRRDAHEGLRRGGDGATPLPAQDLPRLVHVDGVGFPSKVEDHDLPLLSRLQRDLPDVRLSLCPIFHLPLLRFCASAKRAGRRAAPQAKKGHAFCKL